MSSLMSGCPIAYTPYVSGRVFDSKGNPIAGAAVSYGLDQFKSSCFIQRTVTASDGTFHLPMKFTISILPVGRIYIAGYHSLFQGTFQDDKAASFDLIRTPYLFRRIDIHLRRLEEIKHQPLLSYEITHRLKSPPENAEQKQQLIAIAVQNKIPYESENAEGLKDVILNSREPSSRAQAAEFLERHNTDDVIEVLKSVMLADSDKDVRDTCRRAIWHMTGTMPWEFTPIDAQELEKTLSDPKTEQMIKAFKNSDPVKTQLLAEMEALKRYQSQKRE